jgi:glycosyltransferase involved in cell wall biosynthesis
MTPKLKTDHQLAEKPLVSIFCPTFNAEKFIENTLNSILTQDYERIEILISDDCSTDLTVEIVERISSLNPGKIHLNVNEKNLGITSNCNTLLKMCNGKYIAFFAGDDLMYPGKISAQVNVMEGNPDCSFSYHSVEVLDGDNSNRLIFTTERERQSYFSFLDIISRGGLIGVCSVMARLDALPPGGFSSKFPSVSDWLMLIEVALRGRIIKVDGIYGGYLRHSKGASRKTFETLGEIQETLEFINYRYGNNGAILNATNLAFKRYIYGEIARLFISGDANKIHLLKERFLVEKYYLRAISNIFICMIFIKVNKIKAIKNLYSYLSSNFK